MDSDIDAPPARNPGNPTGGQTLAEIVARQAARIPEKPAFVAANRSLCWRDYHERSDALAALFLDLGYARGERLGIFLPDDIEAHLVFLACEKAGLIATALSPRAGAKEIRHLLTAAGATGLVTLPTDDAAEITDLFARLADELPLRNCILLDSDSGPGNAVRIDGRSQRLEAGRVHAAAIADRRIGPDELFLLNSTSGTTGLPKLVAHQQRRWIAWAGLVQEGSAPTADDVFLRAVPASVGFGLWSGHFIPAMLGATTILLPRFSVREIGNAITRHRVTFLSAVTTQLLMMLNAPEIQALDLSSLRCVYTGGEPVPRHAAEWLEAATGAVVLQFYGTNEAGAISHTTRHDPLEKRYTTAGRAIPEVNLRLLGADGREHAPPGEGQPVCTGPYIGLGYYNNPEGNAGLFRGDAMLTEDLVSVDADGYLKIIGRVGDFIIRGGKNISAAGVEAAALTHPNVRQAAAVAMPDPVFGERVCLFASLKGPDELLLQDLCAFLLQAGISKEYLPEKLIVLTELPLNSGGKIAKNTLRTRVRDGL